MTSQGTASGHFTRAIKQRNLVQAELTLRRDGHAFAARRAARAAGLGQVQRLARCLKRTRLELELPPLGDAALSVIADAKPVWVSCGHLEEVKIS